MPIRGIRRQRLAKGKSQPARGALEEAWSKTAMTDRHIIEGLARGERAQDSEAR
jgi:hypothetical protein